MGTIQLPSNRIGYNNALHYSNSQQQLLNIVRLRYMSPPYFLNVNSIVSQFTYGKSVNGLVGNDAHTLLLPNTIWTASGSASMLETPTITYSPIQGKKFITMLLTPMDMSVINMFLHEGWGFSHILRLLVQRVGPVENVALASMHPKSSEFIELSSAISQLQFHDALYVENDEIDEKPATKITVSNFSILKPRQRVVLAKIGLTPTNPYIWLVNKPTHERHHVYLQTRTLFGVFNYLSKGVEIPQEDLALGRVPLKRLENGQIFDWRIITKGLINIRTSKSQPKNVNLSVKFRNNWFYVDDNDEDSRETLDFLAILTQVYEGNVNSDAPLFTVS